MTPYSDQAFYFSLKDRAFYSKVVGVTFEPGYPHSASIMAEWVSTRGGEQLAAVLIRDPDNASDPNAVEVHAPALESRVGFLPAKLAALLAPKLDSGWRPLVDLWGVENEVRPEYPGVRVRIRFRSSEDLRQPHAREA